MSTTNFPTSLDDGTSLPNPGANAFTNAPSHAGQHDTENDAIKAIEAKIGIGASTPTTGKVFRGTGVGTSAWAQLVLTTDVTGTLPVANGGTGLTSLGTGVATFLGTPSSANLAAAMTDETGSGSLVFATSPTLSSPTLVTPTIASFVNATHDHSNAANGGSLGTDVVTNTQILADAVHAAEMLNGMVARRQGGTTGTGSWATAGTSNTDTSATDVFIQVGVVTTSAGADTTVTFPVAFNQIPVVFAQSTSSIGLAQVDAIGTSTFKINNYTTANARQALATQWIAIGQ